VKTNIFVLPV